MRCVTRLCLIFKAPPQSFTYRHGLVCLVCWLCDRFEPNDCPFQFGFHHRPRQLQCCLGSRGTHWAASPLLGSFGCEGCRILIVGPGVKPDLWREACQRKTAAYPRTGHPVSESSLTHICSVLSPPQLSIHSKVKGVCNQLHRTGSCMGFLLSLALTHFFEVRFRSVPQAGLELWESPISASQCRNYRLSVHNLHHLMSIPPRFSLLLVPAEQPAVHLCFCSSA